MPALPCVGFNNRTEFWIKEADILAAAFKRHIELPADTVVHAVSAHNVALFQTTLVEIDAGVHLAVISTRSLDGDIRLLVNHKNAQAAAHQFSGNTAA